MLESARRAWARVDTPGRQFSAAVLAVVALGLWCRAAGLSRGSLYRDDAWVALTRRVPLATAWRMVGTAPGFTLFAREWTALTAPSTWWAQLPELVASLVAIAAMAVLARQFQLSRLYAVAGAVLLAVGRMDTSYATHLKPYAFDLVTSIAIIAAAESFRRGASAWWYVGTALVGLAVAFDVAPVVAGAGVAMAVVAIRDRRVRTLVAPAVAVVVPVAGLYLAIRRGISPRLRASWSPNFLDYHSVGTLARSAWRITTGLVAGYSDTAPHVHVPGLSKLILAVVLVTVVLGATRGWRAIVPLSCLLAAGVAAAAHLEPLGTGRTDAFCYPALTLLVLLGADGALGWFRAHQREVATIGAIALAALLAFTALDRAAYRPTYPGGSINPVVTAADRVVAHHGAVVIEGTARWPWVYYEAPRVTIRFSNLYNTGFYPVVHERDVVVMDGTTIEGGYHRDAERTVHDVDTHDLVLYVRTDDWPNMANPVVALLRHDGYHEVRHAHTPGYLLAWYQRR